MEFLHKSLEALPGARDTDLMFLKNVLKNPVLNSLAEVTEKLESSGAIQQSKPVIPGSSTTSLINEVREYCYKYFDQDRYARELFHLLSNPHFIAVMDAHDQVANKSYEEEHDVMKESDSIESDLPNEETPNAYKIDKIVGIRKKDDEPLGMTFRVEDDKHIVIARILRGGLVDRQGLLHVGDQILEVNGKPVIAPHQLMEQLRLSRGSVTLKIVPSFHESVITAPCYMRALYSYDPSSDSLLPCKELGIAFNQADVLEVLNQEDPNWWQARRTDIEDAPIGLIPSQVCFFSHLSLSMRIKLIYFFFVFRRNWKRKGKHLLDLNSIMLLKQLSVEQKSRKKRRRKCIKYKLTIILTRPNLPCMRKFVEFPRLSVKLCFLLVLKVLGEEL